MELLKKYVDDTPTLNLIGAYTSPIDAVDGIRHNHLDILFLAIHMQLPSRNTPSRLTR